MTTENKIDALRAAQESMLLKPDLCVYEPELAPSRGAHSHIAIAWRGGVVWLDMSQQRDHFCIDVRQFNPDGEMKGTGVFTIVNGRRQRFGFAQSGGKGLPEEPLKDTEGTPVTGHNWNGGYVITLMTDLHGEEKAAIKPSQGNG